MQLAYISKWDAIGLYKHMEKADCLYKHTKMQLARALQSPPYSIWTPVDSLHSQVYLQHLWLEWSGVEWSPLDWTVHLESIWTFHHYRISAGVDWSPVESSGVHWSPLESIGLSRISIVTYLIYKKKLPPEGIEPKASREQEAYNITTEPQRLIIFV